MPLKPRTILGRLIAGTLLTQFVVFACFLFFGIRKEIRESNLRSADRLHRQANILASLAGEAMADNDAGQLSSVFRSFAITTVLRGARLTDENGTTLRVSNAALPSELSPEERGLLFDLKTHPGYRLVKLNPAHSVAVLPFQHGSARGIIWTYPDQYTAYRASRSVLQYAGLYAVCALVGNLLLIWVLSTNIARPLRRLRLASLGVVADSNDLSAFPLPVRGHSETAQLTDGVNAMVAEIGRQRRSTQDTLALLDSMLGVAPIGFAFFDRGMRYVRVNQTLAETHGVAVPAHMGKRLRDLMPPGTSLSVAEQKEHWIEYVFQHGEAVHDREITGEMPGRPGEQRVWRDTFYPIHNSNGEVQWVGVIVTEVTERLRSEEALRRSEKLAAAGRLAASIAHEINNPLESVTNLLYLLGMDQTLSTESQGYVDLAQQELARVSEITQQTLRFYRQSSLPSDTQVADVLRSVLVLHQGKLRAAAVQVDGRIDDSVTLFGYTGELRQLLANLVGNAVDAMPAGGTLYLRVRNSRRDGQPGVCITVADTGTGMPESVRRRIFEPFFTTKEATGTGLGLWVSTEIIGKHRGTIKVRSRAAGAASAGIALVQQRPTGTVFRLFFPIDGVPRGPVMVRPLRQAGPTPVPARRSGDGSMAASV
ncbi:ATP-binding protein [Terriglobus sp.]|uniref:two-component system sensor histidine kinase NtrB n=1 Tax=Terriglobus sp. TaxID=1889013 RepID=UPI003AFFF8CC